MGHLIAHQWTKRLVRERSANQMRLVAGDPAVPPNQEEVVKTFEATRVELDSRSRLSAAVLGNASLNCSIDDD